MMKINGNVWITSDTHYGHNNICRGTTSWRMSDNSIPTKNTRDFADLDSMNSAIVNNINNCVMPTDTLIFLGDWSFGGFDNIKTFYNRLICKNIHFVVGNHDHHILNDKENVKSLFLSVQQYLFLEVNKNRFVLMHYPISSWNGLDKGVIHLHGHMHFVGFKRFGKGKMMDVGMDGHPKFRPYNLIKEILPIMENRPIMSQFENDHHLDGL